jgi:hypothetical protein
MATKTVVCPECAETVPYGRLACPACGSLLAAVAGGVRRTVPLASVDFSEPSTLDDDPPLPAPAPAAKKRGRGQAATRTTRPKPGERAAAAAAAEPKLSGEAAPADHDDEPLVAARAVADSPDAPPASAPAPAVAGTPEPVAAVTRASAPRPAPTGPRTPPFLEDWPADRPIPGVPAPGSRPYEAELGWDHESQGHHPTQPATATASALAPRPSPRPDALGAYLPPSASYVMGAPAPAGVAGGGAYGHATASPMHAMGGLAAGSAAAGSAAAVAPPPTQPTNPLRPGAAPLLADLPFDAPDTLAGWLVAAGSAISTVSFLLPWAERLLGAGAATGYMSQWGLANGVNLLVFLATAVILALATVPNRVPPWIRGGVMPIVIGGLVLGLVWPYLFSGITRFGSMVAAVGGLLLVIGGVLTVRPARHGGGNPAV